MYIEEEGVVHALMGARYYDGQIGKFISEDPSALKNPEKFLSDPQQLNMYSYARDNPLVLVDPSGKSVISSVLGGLGYNAIHQFISSTPNIPNTIRETDFALSYPSAALHIGSATDGSTKNISSVASNFAVNTTQPDLEYPANQGLQGTERNAVRHTVWQGIITSQYGSDVAQQAGNSHEYNPFADLTQTNFSNQSLADQNVDLLNNQIGRSIANQNPGASPQQIAQKTLDYYYSNGLYSIQNQGINSYNVVQSKISAAQYIRSTNELDGLGNGGISK